MSTAVMTLDSFDLDLFGFEELDVNEILMVDGGNMANVANAIATAGAAVLAHLYGAPGIVATLIGIGVNCAMSSLINYNPYVSAGYTTDPYNWTEPYWYSQSVNLK